MYTYVGYTANYNYKIIHIFPLSFQEENFILHTHTHTHTHARTRTRTHARTHARTHILLLQTKIFPTFHVY